MDFFGFCQNVYHDDHLFNFHFPHESGDFLQGGNTMGLNSNESALINESFNDYPQVWDKDQYWTRFPVDASLENNEKNEISEESIQFHSPMVAHSADSSMQSGLEEQDPEILCAEELQSKVADHDSGRKRSSEGEIVDKKNKKKKRSVERGPKYAFKTRSETDVLEDGYKWRKYGKKAIKSSPHPRSYYKCSESNCEVKKRVERDPSDREVLITTYEGKHNHKSPCPTEIYYIADPRIVQQPGSFPVILLMTEGLRSYVKTEAPSIEAINLPH